MSAPVINVAHVAKLANLPLKQGEEDKFAKQLAAILDYISQLQKVDTTKVQPTSQVTGLVNITRPDEVGECLKLDTDYFKVPAIFDHD